MRTEPSYDEILVPADIQEFGDRHKIPEFANATYRNGYMDGFRADRGDVREEIRSVEACLDDAVKWLVALAGAEAKPYHISNCRNAIEQARFYAKRATASSADHP